MKRRMRWKGGGGRLEEAVSQQVLAHIVILVRLGPLTMRRREEGSCRVWVGEVGGGGVVGNWRKLFPDDAFAHIMIMGRLTTTKGGWRPDGDRCLEDAVSRQYLCTHHDHGTIRVDDERRGREDGGGDWRDLYPNNALAYIKV